MARNITERASLKPLKRPHDSSLSAQECVGPRRDPVEELGEWAGPKADAVSTSTPKYKRDRSRLEMV